MRPGGRSDSRSFPRKPAPSRSSARPALAFGGNFGFLQVVFGYLLARIVISTLFLPRTSAANVHGLRTDAEAVRRPHPQTDRRHISAAARAGRGRPGIRDFDRHLDRARHWRDGLHRRHRVPHAVLHVRRRHDRRHLDRRHADVPLRRWSHPQPLGAAADDSRRLEPRCRGRGAARANSRCSISASRRQPSSSPAPTASGRA